MCNRRWGWVVAGWLGALHAGAPTVEVQILAPAEGEFDGSAPVELQVAWNASGGNAATLELVVDGAVTQSVPLAKKQKEGILALTAQVPADGSIRAIQICASQGKGGLTDCSAMIFSAPPPLLEVAGKLRQTMQDVELIGEALEWFYVSQNFLPAGLDALVPTYTSSIPPASPFGLPYRYELLDTAANPKHYRLFTAVPSRPDIVWIDGRFTDYPRELVTDLEKAKLARQDLFWVALALEEYWVDNNLYPVDVAEVLDGYARVVPETDPWGRPYRYEVSPAGYFVFSTGRDGELGGEDIDAETGFRQPVELVASPALLSASEYWLLTWWVFSTIPTAIEAFRIDEGHLPVSLAELVPSYTRVDVTHDIAGNPILYATHVDSGGEHWEAQTAGPDGVFGSYDGEFVLVDGVLTRGFPALDVFAGGFFD